MKNTKKRNHMKPIIYDNKWYPSLTDFCKINKISSMGSISHALRRGKFYGKPIRFAEPQKIIKPKKIIKEKKHIRGTPLIKHPVTYQISSNFMG